MLLDAMGVDTHDGDMLKQLEDDWGRDCRGKDHMVGVDFVDAMFELVDLWSEEIRCQR